jgi:hypothetical protein
MEPTTRTIADALRGTYKEKLMRRTRPNILLLIGLLAGTACSDSTSQNDGSQPPSELNLVRLDQTSPPIFDPEQSFYAVKGEDRELRISFQDQAGGEGEEFLRLRVRPASLLARPDGSPIAEGDSVLITISIVDPGNILFEMEPTGLTFSQDEPAELKIHYNHADHDFNDDGTINAADDEIRGALAIWRQETPSDPFIRLGSVNEVTAEEINADITGFSRYAISY